MLQDNAMRCAYLRWLMRDTDDEPATHELADMWPSDASGMYAVERMLNATTAARVFGDARTTPSTFCLFYQDVAMKVAGAQRPVIVRYTDADDDIVRLPYDALNYGVFDAPGAWTTSFFTSSSDSSTCSRRGGMSTSNLWERRSWKTRSTAF